MSKAYAIVTAAGASMRMGGENKLLRFVCGKEVLAWTLQIFEQEQSIASIVLTARSEQLSEYEALVEKYGLKKVQKIVSGGRERQDSVYAGLQSLADLKPAPDDLVAIHNGANMLLLAAELQESLSACQKWGASVCAFPARDTVKEVDDNRFVVRTLERKRLWLMQTPQCIRYELACRAFQEAFGAGFYGTDDVQLVERLGEPVKIVECSPENIKLTNASDLHFIEGVLEKRGVTKR